MPVDHNKNIIEVENVSFAYGDNKVVSDVTLAVHQGDYLGVIGPNGGGKTTLIKLMLGLLKPDKGQIKIFGQEIEKFKNWDKVGYVAQKSINFDPNFPISVRSLVEMGRFAKTGPGKRLSKLDKKRVELALDQVGLLAVADKLAGELSGGQQQKMFIARALCQEPQIIFLDEPTSGVDLESQNQFYKLLEKLNHELGITLVLISHDIDVVTSEVTEIACINRTLTYHGYSKDFGTKDYLRKMYGEGVKFVVHTH